MTGRRVVVTAGPTREAIDPVRYISNRSSGKMGYAIAAAAVTAGASVTLISGPTALPVPPGVELLSVTTTAELEAATVEAFADADCLVMAAAPVDFAPAEPAAQKLKKDGDAGLELRLSPTTDILKRVAGMRRPGQVVVGFALETDNQIANAEKKLREKGLDLIVVNSPTETTGFDSDTNQVTILAPNAEPDVWPLLDKTEVALRLVSTLAARLT